MTAKNFSLNQNGLSLIDLMVAVAIVGILFSLGSVSYENYKLKTEQKEAITILNDIYRRVKIITEVDAQRIPHLVSHGTFSAINPPATVNSWVSVDPTTCSQNSNNQLDFQFWCAANPGRCPPPPLVVNQTNPSNNSCVQFGLMGFSPRFYRLQMITIQSGASGGAAFGFATDSWAAAAIKLQPHNGKYEVFRIDQTGRICSPYNNFSGAAVPGNGPTQCFQTSSGCSNFDVWPSGGAGIYGAPQSGCYN